MCNILEEGAQGINRDTDIQHFRGTTSAHQIATSMTKNM